jgi:hypothetical protein
MDYENNRNMNNNDKSIIIFNNYLDSYIKEDLKTIYEQYKRISPKIHKKQIKAKDNIILLFALIYLFLIIPFSLTLIYGLIFDNSVLIEIKTFLNSLYLSVLSSQKVIAGWILINLLALVAMCWITAYIVKVNSISQMSRTEFLKIFFYTPEWVLSKDMIELKAIFFAALDPYKIKDAEFIKEKIINLWYIYSDIKTHNFLNCKESFWLYIGHLLGLFIPTIRIFTKSIIYAIENVILWEINKVERNKAFFGVEENQKLNYKL